MMPGSLPIPPARRGDRSASSPSPARSSTARPGSARPAPTTIAEAIQRGLRGGNLKALVVRVDSPGGSTTASERIRQAVLDAKATGLPVVISMGSVAASGGYWIATAGDRIYAEPETITGSIGVFGILPSFEGTLQKLGVGADGVKTTPLSGEPDLLRGPSDEADRLIQMSIDGTYRRFLRPGLGSAQDAGPAGQPARPGPGMGRRHRRASSGWSMRSEASTKPSPRRRAAPGSTRTRASRVYLEKEPNFFDRIFSSRRRIAARRCRIAPDLLGRAAVQPHLMLLGAIADAQRIVAGPAIQVRCLECPPTSLSLPEGERTSPTAWLIGLLAG